MAEKQTLLFTMEMSVGTASAGKRDALIRSEGTVLCQGKERQLAEGHKGRRTSPQLQRPNPTLPEGHASRQPSLLREAAGRAPLRLSHGVL